MCCVYYTGKSFIFAIMKNVFFTFLTALALLFPSGTGKAQAVDELELFQEASAGFSSLFRGKLTTRISFMANGNLYWDQPDFVKGDIVYEGNLYRNVLLNIDAWQQRALVKHASSAQVFALLPSQVSSLSFDGRQFVGIGPGEALPEGFYEVFGTGEERVYKQVKKDLQDSVDNVNGSPIGYYDDNYRTGVYRYFACHPTWYFRDAKGEFSRIKTRGSLLRKFPDRKKDIRKALKAAGLNTSGTNFDVFCKAVLNAAQL